jgi:hypothetical protein
MTSDVGLRAAVTERGARPFAGKGHSRDPYSVQRRQARHPNILIGGTADPPPEFVGRVPQPRSPPRSTPSLHVPGGSPSAWRSLPPRVRRPSVEGPAATLVGRLRDEGRAE